MSGGKFGNEKFDCNPKFADSGNCPNDTIDMCDYERIDAEKMAAAIYTASGEFVLCRNAFRWKKNGKVVPNGYEMFELDSILDANGWAIVCQYGDHIAVCRELYT